MRLQGALLLVVLCTLPARGHDSTPTPQILHSLTAPDSLPTKEELTSLLGPANELAALRSYALDPQLDFGMRLRATRAIPHFCPEHPVQCHEALLAVLDDITAGNDPPGKKILRQRAAIEALGIARSGDPTADRELLLRFLDHTSRDIRVAAVRALRDLCDRAALPALGQRFEKDTSAQVKLVISQAVAVLGQCGP
jgi:hypothetical protein